MTTAKVAAEHISVNARNFTELLNKGAIERQGRGQYNLDDVRKQYILHLRARASNFGTLKDESYEQMRLRKMAADTEKAERQAALLSGDQVRSDDVRSDWVRVCTAIRTNMLSIPAKVAPQLLDIDTVVGLEAVLREQIDQVLLSLSQANVETES